MIKEIVWTPKKQKVSDLKLWEQNPRQISKEAYTRLKERITKRGFHDVVKVDTDNVILSGNQRRRALEELGVKEVWTMIPDRPLTEEERNAVALESNRNDGAWDWDQMANFDLDFLKDMGFDDKELAKGLNLQLDVTEDEAPEPPTEPKSKLGDLYILGNHRLLCGDATKKEDVERLMDGQKADMVFTDPPYRMEAEGGSNQWVGRSAAKVGETIKDLVDFDPEAWLATLPGYFSRGMNAYIFCNKDLVPDYLGWARDSGYAFNILFWKKPNALPLGEQHRPDVEYIILFRKNSIWNNAIPGVSYSKCLDFARDDSTSHPTMKPLGLIANELKISSNENSVIVDPFGGSGSTLIACEQLNRKCYMMEIDPRYCDVIVERWEKFTGRKAVKHG